jgi:hypothetical protein
VIRGIKGDKSEDKARPRICADGADLKAKDGLRTIQEQATAGTDVGWMEEGIPQGLKPPFCCRGGPRLKPWLA